MPTPEKAALSGVDQCHCFALRKAARQITRLYDERLAPAGISITQFLILATLHELGNAAVNALAERLDIERTAMGKMVAVLERDEVVRVRPSPTDGRARIVELTAAGKMLHGRAAPLWAQAQRDFEALNNESNVGMLRRRLATMKVDDGNE